VTGGSVSEWRLLHSKVDPCSKCGCSATAYFRNGVTCIKCDACGSDWQDNVNTDIVIQHWNDNQKGWLKRKEILKEKGIKRRYKGE